WIRDRDELLAQVLKQKGYVARQPVEAQVLTALKVGKPDVIAKGTAAVLDPLLSACDDSDAEIARQARAVLKGLKNVDTQEALCRTLIEREHTVLREAAMAGGYAPRDGNQKVLFYFLTEQWDKFDSLDNGQKLLHAIYEKSEGSLRDRIEEKA